MSAQVVPIERLREIRRQRVEQPEEARLSTDELASALSVSPSTLKRWRRLGLPYETWGPRLYRYQLTRVLAWRREQFGD